MATTSVRVDITADISDFQRKLADMDGKLDGVQGSFDRTSSKVGGAMKGIGGALAAGFAIDKVATFGSEMFTLGTQLEVFDKKIDTVFESSSASVRKWADANNEAFGLSDEQLGGLAANFGDLLKPMGFTAEQAGKMSTDVVGLSGALSAWSGGTKSAAEVSEILAKAMLGERDGLKELGISISEADVQSRLAQKGQEGLTGAALDQAKALATQELIFEKSTDAQKAWANGSMDGIKSTNTLKATFDDLKASIAEKVTPAVQAAAGWFAKTLLPALSAVWSELQAKLKPAFEAISAWWSENGPAIMAKAGELFDKLKSILTDYWAYIQAVLAVIADLWRTWGDEIWAVVKGVFDAVWGVVSGAMDVIGGVIKLVTGIISGDWSKAWDGIKQVFGGVWTAIVGILGGAWGIIKQIFSVMWQGITGVWNLLWGGVTGTVSAAWAGIVGAVKGGIDWVVAFITGMPGRLASAGSGMWNFVSDGFRGAVNAVISGWNKLDVSLGPWSIPDWVPFFGGKKFHIADLFPDIPMLASGGIVTGPTLAMIGERGPEAVIPLSGARSGIGDTHIHFHGPVAQDSVRWVADQIAEGRRRGVAA